MKQIIDHSRVSMLSFSETASRLKKSRATIYCYTHIMKQIIDHSRVSMLSFSETASRLKKSRATIYRYIKEGLLTPYYKKVDSQRPCFVEQEVNKLIDGLPRESIYSSNKLAKLAKKRDGYQCAICFANTSVVAHHVIPLEIGGPDVIENLATVCTGCHRQIHYPNVAMLLGKARTHGTIAIAHWLLSAAGHPQT
jgi:predicted DNA-binding transcriptional regulator AlpA